MSYYIHKVSNASEQRQALTVRHDVFVVEQNVPSEEEFDAFEDLAVHFVALDAGGQGCGAARWRITADGVKLERFAVSKSHRGKGVGRDLVHAVLDDIASHHKARQMQHYLYAQVYAIPFYARFGFVPYGERFNECNIEHQAMEMAPPA